MLLIFCNQWRQTASTCCRRYAVKLVNICCTYRWWDRETASIFWLLILQWCLTPLNWSFTMMSRSWKASTRLFVEDRPIFLCTKPYLADVLLKDLSWNFNEASKRFLVAVAVAIEPWSSRESRRLDSSRVDHKTLKVLSSPRWSQQFHCCKASNSNVFYWINGGCSSMAMAVSETRRFAWSWAGLRGVPSLGVFLCLFFAG